MNCTDKLQSDISVHLRASAVHKPKLQEWQNILVMRLDNIGDVIMTSPALQAIKENLPQCHLTLMASPGGALAAELLPWVDEVLPWRVLWQDLGKLDFDPTREWELVKRLQNSKFDAAIIFTSFSQSPHPAGFLCYLAGIPIRIGESKEVGNGVLTLEVPSISDEVHQVERNLRLIEQAGFEVQNRSLCIDISEIARQEALSLLLGIGDWGLGTGKENSQSPIANPQSPIPNYLLLNPWTSCQSRNYDSQRFAIAARQLVEVTQMPVVVTGVEKDLPKSKSLLETLGDRAVNLIGKTTLPQLAALIANAKLVLTNNTSTMHIADATRTPTVVMFAGTELESQWQPRNGTSWLLRRPTPCSPCYAFTCPYNLECLDIPLEEVVATGLKLIEMTSDQ
ncbi:glycosyltransferase family 9 protein [Scytonema sp. NUACC26]|uniref:glycosyltransferase family 9 protein n=1 Tax=Scytonema sp. NUACC26 TaxID=3140176 RepID=UPI0034DC5CE3